MARVVSGIQKSRTMASLLIAVALLGSFAVLHVMAMGTLSPSHHIAKPFSLSAWALTGSGSIGTDYIELTPQVPNRIGGIWSKEPLNFQNWEVEFPFRAHPGGQGLAFWYSKDVRREGEVFGNNNHWDGLGIFFVGRGEGGRSSIQGVLNDGTIGYDLNTFGKGQTFGSCDADFLTPFGDEDFTVVNIQYVGKTIIVSYRAPKADKFVECLRLEKVNLPTQYSLGISARNSPGEATKHEISYIKTFDLGDDAFAPSVGSVKLSSETTGSNEFSRTKENTASTESVNTPNSAATGSAGASLGDISTLLEKVIQDKIQPQLDKVLNARLSDTASSETKVDNTEVLNKLSEISGQVNNLKSSLDELKYKVSAMESQDKAGSSGVNGQLSSLRSSIESQLKYLEDTKRASDVLSRKFDGFPAQVSSVFHASKANESDGSLLYAIGLFLVVCVIGYGVYAVKQRSDNDPRKFY
eukprot:Nk52_evm28s1810 gene=Nk52_evmTU28s1810